MSTSDRACSKQSFGLGVITLYRTLIQVHLESTAEAPCRTPKAEVFPGSLDFVPVTWFANCRPSIWQCPYTSSEDVWKKRKRRAFDHGQYGNGKFKIGRRSASCHYRPCPRRGVIRHNKVYSVRFHYQVGHYTTGSIKPTPFRSSTPVAHSLNPSVSSANTHAPCTLTNVHHVVVIVAANAPFMGIARRRGADAHSGAC